MLMLVSIESTMTSPTVALARENERSFQAALSAALVCCPTSPEDATYITRRGMSRATTLLLDRRRPTHGSARPDRHGWSRLSSKAVI